MLKTFNPFLIISIISLVGCDEQALQQQNSKAQITDSQIIIGQDERRAIRSIKSHTYSKVGQLLSYHDEAMNTVQVCTASAIGPNHLITAAHCVINEDTNEEALNIVFQPGRTKENPVAKIPFHFINKVYYMKDRFDDPVVDNDIAILELSDNNDEPLKHYFGVFYSKHDNTKRDAWVIGYPSDKQFGTLWESACKKTSRTEYVYHHDCDTYSGMSGAPVLGYNHKYENWYLMGIHSGSSVGNSLKTNTAAKIDSGLLTDVKKILAADTNETDLTHFDSFQTQKGLSHHQVSIKNSCSHDIYVSAEYLKIGENHWTTTPFYLVESGENFEILKTGNSYYTTRVQSKNWTIYHEGDVETTVPQSESLGKIGFKQWYMGSSWAGRVHEICR